jgi:hypothetical protein
MAAVAAADMPSYDSSDPGKQRNSNSDDSFDSTMKFCTRCRTNRPISMFRSKWKKMVKNCAICRGEKNAARRHEVRPRFRVVKPAQLTMVLFSARARRKSTSKPPIYGLSTASPSEIVIPFSATASPSEIVITFSATACHAQTVPGSRCHHTQSAPRSPISANHSARPTSSSH